MDYCIFDVETDGLIETVTKIHCVAISYFVYDELSGRTDFIDKMVLTDYNDIIEFFTKEGLILVGHNIIRYDIPVLEKVLNIKITATLYDTLGLSWYLEPDLFQHGLEFYGEVYDTPKPVIADWTNLTVEEYINRCETDVLINTLLFEDQLAHLYELYNQDWNQVKRLINYLSFKLDCAREQEEVKWRLDIDRCNKAMLDLEIIKQEKLNIISSVMPKKITYKEVTKPDKMFKKDGTPTVVAIKWYEMLDSHSLPLDHSDPIRIEVSQEPGNPNSPKQLKEWLFLLGWIPEIFETSKKTGKEIPQVSLPQGEGLCDSVKDLYSVCPELEALESLYIVIHRIGIFKGFLKNVDSDGFIMAQIQGFTNTLRFKHTTIVNLPSVYKLYSEDIRACLIAPTDNHILCGSDMSSLEDSTKQHYMYFFDPDYVNEMRTPGFDPHLDIAVMSKLLTPQQVQDHKDKKADHSEIRKKAKVINFAGVYGAGPPKIAKSLKCELSFAKNLHTAYWTRNKAVKQVASSVRTKQIRNSLWLFNPVSKFWYSLRAEKDKFSTLNQGTGVYCFDSWVRKVRESGVRCCGQFHDEIVVPLLPDDKEKVEAILLEAIRKTNEEIKLNVELAVSVDFGFTYADIH